MTRAAGKGSGMKVSDYLVKVLEENGITDVFGIPGVGCGHFMNSLIGSKITSHLVYHEQGAAFAACGYAQASNRTGMAYTTAGPGGTNLITGIANAYADSIPTLFLVGEKDLAELRGDLPVRQKASQETDIVNIAKPVTKWSYQVKSKSEIRFVFEKALYLAGSGRPGPVLIDLPSDIARDEIDPDTLEAYVPDKIENRADGIALLAQAVRAAERPLFLAGNPVRQMGLTRQFAEVCTRLNIPFISTLIAFDAFPGDGNYLGFLGMDGDPAANHAAASCDLLITFGARLNFKQIGYQREQFAKNARIIRIDVDPGELSYRLSGREETVCADVKCIVPDMLANLDRFGQKDSAWLLDCMDRKKASARKGSLNAAGDQFMKAACDTFPPDAQIAVDTGSHRRWLISQIEFKGTQRVCQSAGLASMGYALPAAIGIYYATGKAPICIDGDGGIMMNLQELQVVRRENIPMTVFVFNNHALGDIMEFQKRVFDGRYFTTTEQSGYLAADYEGIAHAFHLDYLRVERPEDLEKIRYDHKKPRMIEVLLPSNE